VDFSTPSVSQSDVMGWDTGSRVHTSISSPKNIWSMHV